MLVSILTAVAPILVALVGIIPTVISNRKKTQKSVEDMQTSINTRLDKMEQRIGEQEKSIDANEKDRIRHEVLSFANSCRKKERHTKDEFDHIITLKAKYDVLLKKTGDSNGVFDLEYEFIREIYATCQRENSFL